MHVPLDVNHVVSLLDGSAFSRNASVFLVVTFVIAKGDLQWLP
jgi:hypothetical protein